MFKHLDIIEYTDGRRAIVDKVFADGSCTMYCEVGVSLFYEAVYFPQRWRVVG